MFKKSTMQFILIAAAVVIALELTGLKDAIIARFKGTV